MARPKAVIIACINVMFYLGLSTLAVSQAQCPPNTSIPGLNGPNNGLLNGAHVTIQAVGAGIQSGSKMIQAAANDWTSIPGSNFTFTVVNVNSVQPANASASNPVVIFQVGPASDFAQNGGCAGAFLCTQPSSVDGNGNVVITQIELNPSNTTANLFFQRGSDHELGHGLFGLGDCFNCDNNTTIMASPGTDPTDIGPQFCDETYLFTNSGGAYGLNPNPPPPNPNPRPCLVDGNPCDPCDPDCTPIILDTEGEGFHLTSAEAGVMFDISGTGRPVQIAWTNSNFHNAFLAMPGPDGLVHNGKELFGNFTSQPPSDHPNGFIALAQYDKPENGGNGDGIIDQHDEVFSRLRLWIDENHDGICQPSELHRLPELGVYSLGFNYVESRRTDEFGNQFRYKARVNAGERRDFRDEREHDANEVGRWAYDVFFVTK